MSLGFSASLQFWRLHLIFLGAIVVGVGVQVGKFSKSSKSSRVTMTVRWQEELKGAAQLMREMSRRADDDDVKIRGVERVVRKGEKLAAAGVV